MERDDTIGERCGAILREALRLLVETPAAFLTFLLMMIGVATLVDVYAPGPGGDFGVNAALLFASFGLTMAILTTSVEGGRKGRRGAMTYVGISFLSAFAIGAGLVLLVVPGVILWARWSPVYGYALGEGDGVIEAMGKSWEETRGHTIPIMLASLLPLILPICAVGIMLAAGDDAARLPLTTSIIVNSLVYLGSALGIAVGLAVFSLLARQGSELAGVFE